MSNFQQTIVADQNSQGLGQTSSTLFDLPNAHPISRIFIRDRATHASAITITQDLIEVLVDGSPVIAGLTGDDLRKLGKYDTGREATESGAGGADHVIEQVINFGRFARDPKFALPAPQFSNVQLRINDSLSATPTLHTIDIVVEEILGVDATGMVIRKRSLVNTYSPSASEQEDTKIPTGTRLAAIYVDYADVDNIDGAAVQLGVNNFTSRLFNLRRTAIEALNRQQYPFDDDAIPATMIALDMDPFGDLDVALDARSGKGISDVKLRTTAAGSGVSGTVRVIAEEYVPVR